MQQWGEECSSSRRLNRCHNLALDNGVSNWIQVVSESGIVEMVIPHCSESLPSMILGLEQQIASSTAHPRSKVSELDPWRGISSKSPLQSSKIRRCMSCSLQDPQSSSSLFVASRFLVAANSNSSRWHSCQPNLLTGFCMQVISGFSNYVWWEVTSKTTWRLQGYFGELLPDSAFWLPLRCIWLVFQW